MRTQMSIAELGEKIKETRHDDRWHTIFVVGIIVSVAISSFALGRFSVKEEGSEVSILYPEEVVLRAQNSLNDGQVVVASSKGTRYHYPWCPGAVSMSEANKIEFQSITDARAAGYTPATNCDGLE